MNTASSTVVASSQTDKLSQMDIKHQESSLGCSHINLGFTQSFLYLFFVGPYNLLQFPTINSIISFQVSESAAFKEVTLEKCVNETWKHWLMEETQGSKYIQTGEEQDTNSK
jgi:hypothetical protein